MSALGRHSQTCAVQNGMSALPPKATATLTLKLQLYPGTTKDGLAAARMTACGACGLQQSHLRSGWVCQRSCFAVRQIFARRLPALRRDPKWASRLRRDYFARAAIP